MIRDFSRVELVPALCDKVEIDPRRRPELLLIEK